MKEDPQLVERLVREVIAQLAAKGVQCTPADVAMAPTSARESQGGPTLVVADRIVTWTALAQRLGNAQQVQIGDRAIVTPAAREELKRRGLQLIRGYARPGHEPGPARPGDREISAADAVLFVAACETNDDPAKAMTSLAGMRVERIEGGELAPTVLRLTREILKAKRPGVLLTGSAAAALCLANRNYGIRAIAAGDVRRVDREAGAIGANLLVVDTSAKNHWEVVNAIRAFVRGGWRECPESLRKTLGGV